MITVLKTNSENSHFIELVKHLDADLRIRDGDDHDFYAQYNKTDTIKHTIVAFEKNIAIGCGAIKEYNSTTMEIKRMYVLEEHRGKGIASQILIVLEKWASELGYATCILETGLQQPEAIALYKKSNYKVRANYGQYIGVLNSVCFEKKLNLQQ
jgi:putative acetyltransferase